MNTNLITTSIYISLAFFIVLSPQTAFKIFAQETQEDKCGRLFAACQEFNQSCSESTFKKALSPSKLDSFGIDTYEGEILHLESFAKILKDKPKSTGFIVVYGGRLNKYGEIKERIRRITTHLIGISKLEQQRIIVVKGGFRENFTIELWLSYLRDNYPPLSPTIDAENVVFRGKMKPLTTSY